MATRALYFPHFASGSGFRSSLGLSSSRADHAEARLYDDAGMPWQAFASGSEGDPVSLSGSGVITTDGQGSLRSGSAQVSADDTIKGLLTFSALGFSDAALAPSQPADGFIAPVRRDVASGENTGIAVASIGQAVTVRLTLRTPEGLAASDPVSFAIPANGHIARFIDELFPDADTSHFLGSVTVEAEGGKVVSAAIELGSYGRFVVAPATALRK